MLEKAVPQPRSRAWSGSQAVGMKRLTVALWFLGVLLAIALIAWSDVRSVGAAVASAGWGVALVVAARVAAVAVAGLGWHALFPPSLRPHLSACTLVRFIREA